MVMASVTHDMETPVWRDSRAVALLMAATLTVMANATISPALPGLQRLFADDPNAAMLTRLLVPAPSLSIALLAPLAGLAADRLGRRPLLLIGIVIFVIAGTAGLYLPDLRTILISRLALGVAVALIMTAQTALIGDYFTGPARSALAGLQISSRNFGGLVFILLAGLIAATSPRLPFGVYGLALLVLPITWKVISEPVRTSPYRASGGQAAGTEEPAAWRLLFSGLVVIQALTNTIFFIMPTQLPFFFDLRGADSALLTGATLGVLMLTGGCFALLYSRMANAMGYAGVFALGFALMALGFATLILSPLSSFIGAAMIGAGYALVSPSFVAMTLDLAPVQRRGLAGGILTASVFVGQFCSPLLSTPLIVDFGYDRLFVGASAILAVMAAVAMVAGLVRWR
jgi:MFS family permease